MHRRVRGCCRFQGQGRVSRVGRDGDRRVPTFRLFNDVGTKRCEEGRVYTEVRNAEVATAGSCVGKVPAWLIQMGRGMPRRMCGTMGGPKFNKLGKKTVASSAHLLKRQMQRKGTDTPRQETDSARLRSTPRLCEVFHVIHTAFGRATSTLEGHGQRRGCVDHVHRAHLL